MVLPDPTGVNQIELGLVLKERSLVVNTTHKREVLENVLEARVEVFLHFADQVLYGG